MSVRRSARQTRKTPRKSAEDAPSNVPSAEDAATRRAALELAVRRKIESEKRALQIVERLLEDDVVEDFLVDCGRFISPAHYKDVVEERFIIRSCGYPTCPKKLENVPKQKYRISTKTNKVYDITERKCFCSNFCYRASKYYEAQIPASPIWMRERESTPEIKLMKQGESGHSGLEVKLAEKSLKPEDIENPVTAEKEYPELDGDDADNIGNKPDQAFVSSFILGDQPSPQGLQTQGQEADQTKLENAPKYSDQSKDLAEATERLQVNDRDNIFPTDPSNSTIIDVAAEDKNESSNVEVFQVTQRAVSKRGAEHLRKILSKSKQYQSALQDRGPNAVVKGSMLDVLTQTLNEWKTEETLKYLYGSDYTLGSPFHTNDVSSNSHLEDLDEDDLSLEENATETSKMTSLNECLAFRDCKNVKKQMPEYGKLKEETEMLNIKVQKFFKGHYILPEELKYGQNDTAKTDTNEKNTSSWAPSLPLVDYCSQQQIRKRIVLEKLKKVLPAILLPLQITYSDVSQELHNLVKTFRFTSKNITHTRSEWSVIAIVLLFALLPTMPLHRDSQQSPIYTQFISKLLEELQFQTEDLESLKQTFTCKHLVI